MPIDAFVAPADAPSMDASRLIWLCEQYLQHKKVAAGTKKDYREKINHFLKWSSQYTEITETDMDNFAHYLANSGLKLTTQRDVVTRVGQMFNWAHGAGYARLNYMLWLPVIKAPRTLFDPVSPAAVQSLLDACTAVRHTERAQAMIAVMAGAGLRLNEMVLLDAEDISFDSDNVGSIKVRSGKNSQSRITGLMPGFGAYVRHWCDIIQTGALMISARSGRLHPDSAYVEFIKIATHAGLKDVSPHDMRRFFATQWIIKHPGRIIELQKLMGHSDPAMTARYVWLTPDYLKEIIRGD